MFTVVNAYLQMRLEESLPNLFRRAFPNAKTFSSEKLNNWIEANQHHPYFLSYMLDALYMPVGHTTPVSHLLENGTLTTDEFKLLKETVSFFYESVQDSSNAQSKSPKASRKKRVAQTAQEQLTA